MKKLLRNLLKLYHQQPNPQLRQRKMSAAENTAEDINLSAVPFADAPFVSEGPPSNMHQPNPYNSVPAYPVPYNPMTDPHHDPYRDPYAQPMHPGYPQQGYPQPMIGRAEPINNYPPQIETQIQYVESALPDAPTEALHTLRELAMLACTMGNDVNSIMRRISLISELQQALNQVASDLADERTALLNALGGVQENTPPVESKQK